MKADLSKILLGMGLLLFTGCGNLEKEMKPVRDEQTAHQTTTTGRIDHSIYQSLLQEGVYQASPIRGLTANGIQNGYNQKSFERGLLRLSHENFSADQYYFREGQVLDEETVKAWLGRETKDNPQGLNSEDLETPLIFQQLLAYEFLEEDGKKVGGMSLGFSFTRYFEQEGVKSEVSKEIMMKQVHKTVSSVLARIRKIPGYERIPVQVNIYEQAPANQLVGGHYIYTAVSEDGGQSIDEYEDVEERDLLLPVVQGTQNLATEKGLNQQFLTLKNTIQTAFPNLVSVTGIAYFVDEKLIDFTIKIDSKYFSQSEIASYTQFIGKQIEALFKEQAGNITVEVSAIGVPQALIIRKNGEKEILSHLFN